MAITTNQLNGTEILNKLIELKLIHDRDQFEISSPKKEFSLILVFFCLLSLASCFGFEKLIERKQHRNWDLHSLNLLTYKFENKTLM